MVQHDDIDDAVCNIDLPPSDEQPTTDEQPPQAQVLQHQLPQQQVMSGPFGLDPQVVADIERNWVRVDQMIFQDPPTVDISLLNEPIRVLPTPDGFLYPQDRFEELISRSHYIKPQSNDNMMPTSNRSSTRQMTHETHQNPKENSVPRIADPQLEKIIKAVSSTDTLKARVAIYMLIEKIEAPDEQSVLHSYEEIFIQNVLAQLTTQSLLPMPSVYQPLLIILYTFFNANNLGKMLSVACLKNLMSSLLQLLSDQTLAHSSNNNIVNGICLKVMDTVNFTNICCVFICLLKETSLEDTSLPESKDLIVKCNWRIINMLTERSNELNYDALILELHAFLLSLPCDWWQTQETDMPLRVVQTIIQKVVKLKGNAILQHVKQIPINSELHTYLLKCFKKDDIATVSDALTAHEIATNFVAQQKHVAVSQIFQLISNDDTKEQGLQKLYDFKQRNPDIELSPFLQDSSATFRKYIEECLAEIERNQNAGSDNRNQTVQHDPDWWMARLHSMMSTQRSAKDGSHMLDNKAKDDNEHIQAKPDLEVDQKEDKSSC